MEIFVTQPSTVEIRNVEGTWYAHERSPNTDFHSLDLRQCNFQVLAILIVSSTLYISSILGFLQFPRIRSSWKIAIVLDSITKNERREAYAETNISTEPPATLRDYSPIFY